LTNTDSNPVNKIIETIFHLNQKLSSSEGIQKMV